MPLIAAALLFVLVAGGAIVAGRLGRPTPKCIFDCGPQVGSPLPEARTFTSAAFGFQVDYPDNWGVADSHDDGVALDAHDGIITVTGVSDGRSDEQQVNASIADLPSSDFEGITELISIEGARVGPSAGIGKLYEANAAPHGAQAKRVRIAVLSATRGSLSVVVRAVMDFDDGKKNAASLADADAIDYLLSEFRWP